MFYFTKHNHLLITVFFLSTTAIAAEQKMIIGFHEKIASPHRELINNHGGVIQREYDLIPAIVATLPESALSELGTHPLIAYIEENATITIIEPPAGSAIIYSPGVFTADTSQNEYDRSWGVKHIGAKAAHQQGITGKGVKIAVIDTGIDFHHEELDDNYRGGYNFIDESTPPLDDSYNSHGTNVAGIIAAEKNGTGVVGVAPEASLYSLKVLDERGSGSVDSVIAALQWSIDNDMDIANISIQGGHTEAFEAACKAAHESGLLIIAAAGNTYGARTSYPATYSSVVSVTGTDAYDQRGDFAPIDTEIELSAPGVLVPSTAIDGAYGTLSGTSQAAPHAAGTAALIMSEAAHYPAISGLDINEDTRTKLQLSTRELGLTGKDDIYGYGLVSAELPATIIDKVTCTGNTVTVEGKGFGRYLKNENLPVALTDTGTAEKCGIENWTTSKIIADCGLDASGSVKVTSVFGSAESACISSPSTPARPKWWLIESWWSSWH